MDTPNTARLARRRSAASLDRVERGNRKRGGSRASYSARRANRAGRQVMSVALRALTR